MGKKGFTIIELLLVIAIIIILSSLFSVAVGMAKDKARRTSAQAEISSLSLAVKTYESDYGIWPANLNVLTSTSKNGPYMEVISKDPWDKAYTYAVPGTHNTSSFDIYSWGPNATDDSGAVDDITNWK
jgi:general secretion pathway protein G